MNLNEMSPDKLIRSCWLNTYEKEIDALWWQLVQLNNNLFIMEHIAAFPFGMLTKRTPFWQLVYASLFETNVMIIWRLIDTKKKALTLISFKNNLRDNLSEEEYRAQFDNILQDIDFENKVSSIRKRIIKIRHNQLGHFQRKWIVDPTPEQIKERHISLPELENLRNELNSLFDLLCFEHKKSVFLIDYDPRIQHPVDSDSRSDIERLLDSIARESALLNMPEEQPAVWPLVREQQTSKGLEVLNRYRKKFNLPEV